MTGFFCADCGARVPRDADSCPVCKAAFSSVKCPKCGFIGSAQKFINGCPQCGYLKKTQKQYAGPVAHKKEKALPSRFIFPVALVIMLVVLIILIARVIGLL